MRTCITQVQPVAATNEIASPTAESGPLEEVKAEEVMDTSRAATPIPASTSLSDDQDVAEKSSTFPLDAAIAASISAVGNENKTKTASAAILVIGGSSALKGLNAFLAERYVRGAYNANNPEYLHY